MMPHEQIGKLLETLLGKFGLDIDELRKEALKGHYVITVAKSDRDASGLNCYDELCKVKIPTAALTRGQHEIEIAADRVKLPVIHRMLEIATNSIGGSLDKAEKCEDPDCEVCSREKEAEFSVSA